MSLISRVKHEDVEIVRVGISGKADNTASMIFRLGDTVIDTGPPNQWKHVKNYLSEISFKQVILTHYHEDHSGNGGRIAKKFKVPVYIHDAGFDYLQNGFTLRLFQMVIWGKQGKYSPGPMPKVVKTDSGHTLEPIYTPGHSPDHVCFFEPEKKWLFAGDSFLAIKQKLVRKDESLENTILSLKKLLTYDFETVFCSHKGVLPDGYALIEKKLEYYLNLVNEAKELNSKGKNVTEITHKLLGKKDTIGIMTFKFLSKKNLIEQCVKIDASLAA